MAEHGKNLVVENQTRSAFTRVTVENKRITYRLHVIQQPLRARACGSGAKSSADRRPVDPPPIVELKIYEGEPNHEEDITFKMNANYFLFATLEPARPITQGRVPEDKNRACVLTGAPVVGMSYLDRPAPAGYFIFPDLSVRHEGNYRLSFSLYEELKNPHDFDKADENQLLMDSREQHVTHRLEVKSIPFIVYSAKKFPGLTESTNLSRVVAEQGCRVRIRRDVRMRKRETKPGKDWDDYEDETAAVRASLSGTPDGNRYGSSGFVDAVSRPRSASNTSLHSMAANAARRSSSNDLGSQYHSSQYNGAPRTPQTALVPASPYGCTPAQQYNQPAAYASQHTTMQPPPPMYAQPPQQHQHQPYSNTPVQNDTHPPTGNFYSFSPSMPTQQQPHFVASAAPCHEVQLPPARSSTEYHTPVQQDNLHSTLSHHPGSSTASLPNMSQLPHESQGYAILPGQHYSNQQTSTPQPYTAARHIQSHNMQEFSARPQQETIPVMKSGGHFGTQLPPLQISDAVGCMPEPVSPITPSHMVHRYPHPEVNHKRSFGAVFDDRHLAQPLRDGARPNTLYTGGPSLAHPETESSAEDAESVANIEPHPPTMRYRRADGSSITRALPPHGYEN